MNRSPLIRIKLGIGMLLLFGVLGVNLVSMWNMDHSSTVHSGCIGISTEAASCVGIADIATCLQAHLGLLQSISQGVPSYVSQFLLTLLAIVIVWYGFRWKNTSLSGIVTHRLRPWEIGSILGLSVEKIGRWLALFEKRDPAPTSMVLGIVPIRSL